MKRTLMALLTLLALIGAGCGGGQQEGQPKEGETPQRTEEAGRKISITGNEYSFRLPRSITGGFVDVEFKNEGRLKHEAAFTKVDPDTPQDQFIRDLKVAIGDQTQPGPIAAYIKPYVGVAEADANRTETWRQALPAGTYYLACTLTDADSVEGEQGEGERPPMPNHFEQGMISKVTVTDPSQVNLPQAAATITGTEYAFDISGIRAGRNEVLFRNAGPREIHTLDVLEFPEGVDEPAANRALQAFATQQGPPPPGTPEPKDVAFGGLFDVGGGSLFEFQAQRGRVYAFVCFIHDRAGGPPHLAKGMSRVLTVR